MSNPNPIQQEENAVKTLSGMKSTPGSRPSKTWTAEEDALVTKQMLSHANLPQEEQEKFTQWAGIAALLPGRTGRQVRDRWSNHLNPIIIHEPFTTEDDIKLWNAATTVGKKWVEISSTIFKGTRSENQCKNRWNSAAFKVWVARTYGNQGTSYVNPNALSQTYKRTLEDGGTLELAPSPVKQVKSRKKKAKNYQAMELHNPDIQREAYSNCVAGYLESKGKGTVNPSNSKKPKAVPTGISFTAQEDTIITENVGACPQEFCSWQVLADTKLPGRTGKQIRDRWNNYLNPVLNHNAWSAEEDQRLWEAHAEYGRKWTVIGQEKFHTTRSENQLKNRFYSAGFKKFVRRKYGDGAYEGAKVADEARIIRESSPSESGVRKRKVADKEAPVVSIANKSSSNKEATGDQISEISV